jgi:hypothetical protein
MLRVVKMAGHVEGGEDGGVLGVVKMAGDIEGGEVGRAC